MAVSKADIIDHVAMSTGISKRDVKSVVYRMLRQVSTELKKGQKVQLTGFGTFEVRERKARSGVRPSTTERITIPARKYPAFKPGKGLKDGLG